MNILKEHRENRIDIYVKEALKEKENKVSDKRETQRIDKLADIQIADLKEDIKEVNSGITRIEKMLIGNGSEGLVQKCAKNSARIKMILLILSGTLIGGGIGGAYSYKNNTQVQKPSTVEVKEPQPEVIANIFKQLH